MTPYTKRECIDKARYWLKVAMRASSQEIASGVLDHVAKFLVQAHTEHWRQP